MRNFTQLMICLIILSCVTAITSVLPFMRSAWSVETCANDRDVFCNTICKQKKRLKPALKSQKDTM